MKPTHTATLVLYPSSHRNQTPPTSANGSASMTMSDSVTLPKFRYSSSRMIPSVTGTTSRSFCPTRCMAPYCPLQVRA